MAVTTPQQAHKMRLQAVIAGGAQIEGHGGLFFGSRAGGAGGANLAKGCVGVPEEVFLHIVSYFVSLHSGVEFREQEKLTHSLTARAGRR